MTNREYLNNKKEAIYSKIEDFFVKYFKIIFCVLLLANIVSIVCIFKIDIYFLAAAIPLTLVNIIIIYGLISAWLECEHEEKTDDR